MNIINLYFISAYIQHSGDHLGPNPQYVYYNGNLVSFAGATILLTLIFGILTIFLSNIISSILHKKIIKKISKKHPYDKIICKFYPANAPMSIAEFGIGGASIGMYIAPLFIFKEITHIDIITRQNLSLLVLALTAVLTVIILFKSYTLVLTNKRIIGLSYGGLVRNTLFSFDDIKSINKTFGGWEIISKDGTMLPLKCHPKAKKFYNKLKELMNKEKINEQC